jgi:REP element-mobilizing transposase RayT
VYARGTERRPIYRDDRDRLTYLEFLARVSAKMRWRCLAYCLMGNHVHLLVETREPNLGRGMHRLHGRYAQHFNFRYRRSGHLFGDRFGAVRMRSDPQVWVTAAYIARNPVEACLCRSPADWHWSSHSLIADDRAPDWLDIDRLLAYFDAAGGDARARYVELVDALAKPVTFT